VGIYINKKMTSAQQVMAGVGRRILGSGNVYAMSENSNERKGQKPTSCMNAHWVPLHFGNRMAGIRKMGKFVTRLRDDMRIAFCSISKIKSKQTVEKGVFMLRGA